MNDHELLRAFEECSLPHDQWTHRCHVKIAYLYLRRFPYAQALDKIRNGIRKYNAAKGVAEGPTSGYNETTTVAFARLVAATIDAHEPVAPASTADEFCDANPQLMTSRVLRLFYSPAIRTNLLAKTQFVEPDLAALPMPKAAAPRREAIPDGAMATARPMVEPIARLTDSQFDDLRRLYEREWWTQGRSEEQVRRLVEASDIVVAFCEADSRRLVAFARVITDFAIKALILDVIVDRDYRQQGLGGRLFDAVVTHPALQAVRHLELYCRPELVPFYERWGFTDSLGELRFMRLERKRDCPTLIMAGIILGKLPGCGTP